MATGFWVLKKFAGGDPCAFGTSFRARGWISPTRATTLCQTAEATEAGEELTHY